MKKKNIEYTIGSIVAIPFEDGSFGYGRVLDSPEMAFYNRRTQEVSDAFEVISEAVLFRLFVQDQLIKDGTWIITGRLPLSGDLLRKQPYFIWGPFQKNPIITYDGSEKIEATPEQCESLERLIIWDAETAVKRLYDNLTDNYRKWIQRVEQE